MSKHIIFGCVLLIASLIVGGVFILNRRSTTATPQYVTASNADYAQRFPLDPAQHRQRYYFIARELNVKLQSSKIIITADGFNSESTFSGVETQFANWVKVSREDGTTQLLPPSGCTYLSLTFNRPTAKGTDIATLKPQFECHTIFDTDNLQTFYAI